MNEEWSSVNGLEDLLQGECGSILDHDKSSKAAGEVGLGDSAPAPGIKPIFNQGKPAYVNQKEKYEHRLVAHLKAAGNSNTRIAEILGMSNVTINYLVKQPYVETMVLEEMQRTSDATQSLLAQESFAAAQRLIEIAKSAENDETRRKANNDILDRKYGKPNQPMSVKNVSAEEVSDAELLQALKQN